MLFCPEPKCKNEPLAPLGSTIGATRLMGCPRCKRVYWEVPEAK
jgi:uncharacterized protein with PIN domain